MSFLRPEAAAALARWREVIAGAAVAAAGVWLAMQGGPVLAAGGAALALAGLWLMRTGLIRLRLAGAPAGPGMVEIVEGRIGWYGPGIGGFAALHELTAVGRVTVAGIRCWRLMQADGSVLLVPVGAAGAAALCDALATLPGLDAAALARALAAPGEGPVPVWRRSRPAALAPAARP